MPRRVRTGASSPARKAPRCAAATGTPPGHTPRKLSAPRACIFTISGAPATPWRPERTGASLRDLMTRMGHASARAALIYQHASSDRDRAIAAALDELLRRHRDEGTG